ncbi:MAG: TIGR02302 family protein [Paracoccaceae bacterium]
MTEEQRIAEAARARLMWALRLTRAGIAAERITRGFWPVWSVLFAVIAAFAFGLHDALPLEVVWIGGVALIALFLWTLWRGIAGFRWPTPEEAAARIDATLPGRPLAALSDRQATGAADAGSAAVWRAHLRRMADRALGARPARPDLRVAARDPYALRYAAFAAFLLAVLFGSLWRVTEAGGFARGGAPAAADSGPSWEAWIEPPSYTGKPSLYLNEVEAAALDVPVGSAVTVRLYGTPGEVSLAETVSAPKPAGAEPAAPDGPVRSSEFEIARSGTLAIDGAGGRSWRLNALPDAAPAVELSGPVKRDADGVMTQPFTAKDDYGVVRGRAIVTLDLAAVIRRHGLAVDPEAREALVFDLPMPISGDRAEFSEALVEDASKHPWANLPVTIALGVEDGRGQTGATKPQSISLPGRRFFDPVANAVIELRRDLLWNRTNGERTLQVLRAITNRPEQLIRDERAYLMLRVAMRRLEAGVAQGPISAGFRDEIAEDFWKIAELIEDGGLSNALERMQEAQERLSEAMRNGASPEEIQRLMDELRQATDDYIDMLAQNMERQKGDGTDERDMSQNDQQNQMITGDQIQEMMDQIQKLMEEGRMAEAQELLEQLNRLMQNLKIVEGQGQGRQGPGAQGMQDLQNTLRDQQGLSDDTFGQLQDQFDPGANQPGQRPGQQRGQRPGENGQGGEGTGEGSLADRQQGLRDQLGRQAHGTLPGEGTPEGEAARQALEDAGRAMDDAEQALRDGDLPGAIDRQAEAIENLREGLRGLGEAFARQNQPGTQGEAFGDAGNEVPRDPLGRAAGANGRLGTDENMLQGKDVYRRAQELLEEIRRRSAERARPPAELDYLKRLLDVF